MDEVTEKTLDSLKLIFARYDRASKWIISTNDLAKALKEPELNFLNLTDSERQEIVASLDPQDTGYVSYPDYFLTMSSAVLKNAEDAIHSAFGTFYGKGAEKETADGTTLLHIIASTGTEMDKTNKKDAAKVLKIEEDKLCAVRYKDVTNEESAKRDSAPYKEEVFREGE
eukprot:TRINITY_DN4338_c0_g1_i1.p1 TRINITY_DN4338_c0_g1~~TRINITY_DN4338_c0_g1_i1.p1  ORF type:complete len:170 (+),score=58.44 TRINITY_DN4338_c0_g1_i1:463-972(+)